MRGIGKRLLDARKAKGLTQAGLAKAVGLSQTAITELEKGRSVDSAKIVELAQALDVTPQWLRTGKAADGASEPQRAFRTPFKTDTMLEIWDTEFGRIPIYDIRVAAGVGAQNHDETPIDYHMISMSLLHALTDSPLKYIAGLQVMGDSMEPTLHNKDWVLIDMHQSKLTREGIYALNFEGDAIVKRASQHLETRAVTLTSDNPKYPAQTIKKPDRLSVIGRVILSIRRH